MKRNIVFVLLALVSISFVFTSCTKDNSEPTKPKVTDGSIDADHPDIHYVGRFDTSNPKQAVFDWPGVYVRAAFEGTSCAIRLVDGKNLYNVTIDDNASTVLATDTATVYSLATDLPDTVHTIMIQKRTEASVGKGTFLGFQLDEGKNLVTLEAIPERKIEFIGNSITCGYGVEGKSANEPFKPETENATLTYAGIVSRALEADYALVAYSGRGAVRNYGDANKTSDEPMPSLYDRFRYSDEISKWDFTKYIPQVVVINLGTNDFSTEPHPDKDVFQNAYTQLINTVQTHYADVSIFCISGPMIGEPAGSYIQEVVEQCQQNNVNKNVFYIGIPTSTLTMADRGSDWHPNIPGQQKIANAVLPVIREKMNW